MAIKEAGSTMIDEKGKSKPNGKPTEPHPRPTARAANGKALDGSDGQQGQTSAETSSSHATAKE